jgi:putative Holliday junction resolvase
VTSGTGDRPRPSGAVLGIDLGERRIGVAIGDYETRSAAPLTTLGRSRQAEADASTLARLAAERNVRTLVIGLPLNMDGSEGPQAARTRQWGAVLARITGLPVRFRDERLTSVRATQRLTGRLRGGSGGPPSGARRQAQRARIDREAATLILQDELDGTTGQAPETAPAEPPARGDRTT